MCTQDVFVLYVSHIKIASHHLLSNILEKTFNILCHTINIDNINMIEHNFMIHRICHTDNSNFLTIIYKFDFKNQSMIDIATNESLNLEMYSHDHTNIIDDNCVKLFNDLMTNPLADITAKYNCHDQNNKIIDSQQQSSSQLQMQSNAKLNLLQQHNINPSEIVDHCKNEIAENSAELNHIKNVIEKIKDKRVQARKLFEIDYELFFQIKKDIQNNKITNVPELFVEKYMILDFLEHKSMLSKTDEIFDIFSILKTNLDAIKNDQLDNSEMFSGSNRNVDLDKTQNANNIESKYADIIYEFVEFIDVGK
jgi:hypothetical protein